MEESGINISNDTPDDGVIKTRTASPEALGKIEITCVMDIPSKVEYIDIVRDRIVQAINNVFDTFSADIPVEGGFVGSFSFGYGTLLAVDEALQNAIIHGNKEDPSKKVQIIYYLCPDYLEITIRDEGEGFDWRAVVEEYNLLKDSKDPDVFMKFSRGLFLILKTMDEVTFNDQGNEITILKYRKQE